MKKPKKVILSQQALKTLTTTTPAPIGDDKLRAVTGGGLSNRCGNACGMG